MMRHLRIIIEPPARGIHPVGADLASVERVQRKQLLHINALSSGNGLLFYRLEGDPDAATDALDAHQRVIKHELTDVREDEFYLYVYVSPGEPAGTLMYLVERYALIVDTPITFTGDASLRVTVAGKQEMLRKAFHEFPDHIGIRIEQAGEYAPGNRELLSELTDRQREVLETAVDLGYYELPRRVTRDDIARELDCATSTVDEHIRRAESRLLSAIVG